MVCETTITIIYPITPTMSVLVTEDIAASYIYNAEIRWIKSELTVRANTPNYSPPQYAGKQRWACFFAWVV